MENKTKKLAKLQSAVIIGILMLSLPLNGSDDERSFQLRKQAWLSRDGRHPSGGFDSNPHTGRSFLFAWLEGGKYLTSGPDGLSSLPEQIRELMPGYGENVYTASGSMHETTLARIYYQYYDKLQNWIDQGLYSDTTILTDIESYFNSGSQGFYNRSWQHSTQPIYTPLNFLWTQIHRRDETVEFPENSRNNIGFVSSYSGKEYIEGGLYNFYELVRDWMIEGFDTWVRVGSLELDGNYTHHITYASLMLYDFANRSGVPQPDGQEMQRRAKMMADFMCLEMGLDFSAAHFGGTRGREYKTNLLNGSIRWPYHSLLGLPEKNWGYTYRDGHAYVSDYRAPEVILDLVNLDDEPANYWHINMEKNIAANYKWTYVTPYFNLGGSVYEGLVGTGWQLNILSNDGSGQRKGQPFKLWIDTSATGGVDSDPDFNIGGAVMMGTSPAYQYRNAMFLKIYDGDHLHLVRQNNRFDIGEENLIQGNMANDYSIGPGWKFFLENKTAIAMRKIPGSPVVWGMEVVVIDETVTSDNVYASFDVFKESVLNNAQLDGSHFRTSRGDVITESETGGRVNGQDIWNLPFKRIECVDFLANKMVSWDPSGNSGVMTISKNGRKIIYDFNNWTYSGSGVPGDTTPPSPPKAVKVQTD